MIRCARPSWRHCRAIFRRMAKRQNRRVSTSHRGTRRRSLQSTGSWWEFEVPARVCGGQLYSLKRTKRSSPHCFRAWRSTSFSLWIQALVRQIGPMIILTSVCCASFSGKARAQQMSGAESLHGKLGVSNKQPRSLRLVPQTLGADGLHGLMLIPKMSPDASRPTTMIWQRGERSIWFYSMLSIVPPTFGQTCDDCFAVCWRSFWNSGRIERYGSRLSSDLTCSMIRRSRHFRMLPR